MRNRYGDIYHFEKLSGNIYTIVGDLKYWRYGGREGQQKMDMNDIGFVDPSGGPFISIGDIIEGRRVVRIRVDSGEKIIFEVE
jgi:hypothetical protein